MTTICPTCGISVLEHPANRCLDSWVAEKVMRWERIKYFGCAPITDSWVGFWDGEWFRWIERPQPDDEEAYKLWSPSTDLANAWEVVEKLGYNWTLTRDVGKCGNDYETVGDMTYRFIYAAPGMPMEGIVAETPMLAVCRAALLAMIDGK